MFLRRLPRFEYFSPTTVKEALDLMASSPEKTFFIAGGTDLLVSLKRRERTAERLINLKCIDELRGIRPDGKGGVAIGALTTLADLERSSVVKKDFGPLWQAVCMMASPQIRSLATIGGNLCSAVPSADTVPPLIVMDAVLKVTGHEGQKLVAVEDFFKGPKESILKKNEILNEILIPPMASPGGGSYLKLMRRNAMDIALVGVGVYLTMDPNSGICTAARIALGAVAPTPIRAREAEWILVGKEISISRAEEAARIASSECSPVTDVRASAEYRRKMVEVLTKRAIIEAARRFQIQEQAV